MWKNCNAQSGISVEASCSKACYSNGNDRSLQRAHLECSSLKLDAEACMVSSRKAEVEADRTTPTDCVQTLKTERLSVEEKQNLDGTKHESKQRPPSFDFDKLKSVEIKKIDDLSNRMVLDSEPCIPEVSVIKKYASTYELEKYKKNAMIIFNHKDFMGGQNTRAGTTQDEEALKTTFRMFNFEVESHLNLDKRTLLQKLKQFCSKDFRAYGCVCVAILTHGSKYGYLKAYDTRYSEHEIIECFDVQNNLTLFGKPIIILIQACRGGEPATACVPGTMKSEDIALDNDEHYELPAESNMVIFHSSYVGRASARDVHKGSWFIQTLCEQIKLLATVEDFESICRAVRQKVALDKEHKMILNDELVIIKQMPVLTSTLLRLLYLRKYKGNIEDDINPKEQFVKNEDVNIAAENNQAKITRVQDTGPRFQQLNEYSEWCKQKLELMSSLEKRELQFRNVIDRGEALIAQHHPAAMAIEAHLQLALCLETHFKHYSQYHNFFKAVQDAEKWIQKREEILKSKFSQSEFTLDQGERLLRGMQELREELNSHGGVVSRLVEEAQTIRPMDQRDPDKKPPRAETVCAYKQDNVAIEKGSVVTVVDSDGVNWRVRLDAGVEVQLPFTALALLPPCAGAQDAAKRLRDAHDRAIQLWATTQLTTRQNMMFATIKVVKNWNHSQFVEMGKEKREVIRRALNEDADKLFAEGNSADPLLRTLRRELFHLNNLFNKF